MDNGKQKSSKEEEKTNKKETRNEEVIKNPNVTITTTIDSELYKKAKINRISWKNALNVGICLLLNEIEEKGN